MSTSAARHFGLICPELSGHLNPMTTLGRELKRRGHRVSVLARMDAKRKAESAGLEFRPVGVEEFPAGSIGRETLQLGALRGWSALRFTVDLIRRQTAISFRDLPGLIREAGIDALLVDQVSPGGGSVAEAAVVPFVTVCNALALAEDPSVPPGILPWSYSRSGWARYRNRFGYWAMGRATRPVWKVVADYRRGAGLPPIATIRESQSKLLQIAQQPELFDFPGALHSPCFHYTGPFHDEQSGDVREFPFERLDGRPLLYASMGTLQNRLPHVFQTIAEACVGLDVQLAMSLGNRDAPIQASFPGDPIVVSYAPQLELLKRATAVVTHAGLNTVLEGLTQGVPMVAIPITNDQPGVASRLAYLGFGEVIQPTKLTALRLRSAIRRVLEDSSYRQRTEAAAARIGKRNGLSYAADLVESAVAGVAPAHAAA